MSEHTITICKKCGKVIMQCRCMSKNKTKIYSLCSSCGGEKEKVLLHRLKVSIWHCPKCLTRNVDYRLPDRIKGLECESCGEPGEISILNTGE